MLPQLNGRPVLVVLGRAGSTYSLAVSARSAKKIAIMVRCRVFDDQNMSDDITRPNPKFVKAANQDCT